MITIADCKQTLGTYKRGIVLSSVSDPYSFDTIWIQHFRPIRIQGFDDKKLNKIASWKKNKFWDQKLQFTYP